MDGERDERMKRCMEVWTSMSSIVCADGPAEGVVRISAA